MIKLIFQLFLLVAVATASSASDITWADKTTGGQFTATDANEIKTAVNSKIDKQPSTLALTTDTSISEAQILSNAFIGNYGAAGEVDITLPAVSYNIVRTILVQSSQIIEIGPPSGEQLYYQGTALTADYVIDSPNTIGSMAVITRVRTGASSWVWNVGVVQGAFSNPGRITD